MVSFSPDSCGLSWSGPNNSGGIEWMPPLRATMIFRVFNIDHYSCTTKGTPGPRSIKQGQGYRQDKVKEYHASKVGTKRGSSEKELCRIWRHINDGQRGGRTMVRGRWSQRRDWHGQGCPNGGFRKKKTTVLNGPINQNVGRNPTKNPSQETVGPKANQKLRGSLIRPWPSELIDLCHSCFEKGMEGFEGWGRFGSMTVVGWLCGDGTRKGSKKDKS